MLLGGLLVPCNVYTGLKIGWSFNMSITAALLSLAFWKTAERTLGTSPWGLYENNINQTAASAGASIVSAGLVAPIPALAILTGNQLPWHILAVWTFCVSILGVMVAVGLRRQMLVTEKLPFPAGVATGEVMKDIYAHGKEALARLKILATGAVLAGTLKGIDGFLVKIPKIGLPGSIRLPVKDSLSEGGFIKITFQKLGFALDPSLLMLGFGAIIGPRIGVSLLIGAIFAWGLLGPLVLEQAWIVPKNLGSEDFLFGSMVEWLLWPGATMMFTASLTTFTLAAVNLYKRVRKRIRNASKEGSVSEFLSNYFRVGLIVSISFAVIAQVSIFNISLLMAVIAAVLTLLLAVVAARVSGETGIPPIGALGKVTQLTFGVISPADATTNLMSANVTGGAAGQCSDLLHDFKAGLLINASWKLQSIAQIFGILAGSLAGSAVYLILIPDPQSMLLTTEWPAPAVATWKAVAEVFQKGWTALPQATPGAMEIAGAFGLLMGIMEKQLPKRWVAYIPSATSIGLAFIIPAWISISMFMGGIASWAIVHWIPEWHQRFMIVLAAGLVAGESLMGVAQALLQIIFIGV